MPWRAKRREQNDKQRQQQGDKVQSTDQIKKEMERERVWVKVRRKKGRERDGERGNSRQLNRN